MKQKTTQDNSSRSDEQLAVHAQNGSIHSFEELVYRYEKRIFGFISCRVSSVDDAQDLTQDTFLKTYINIKKYKKKYSFSTWLFTIARREVISFYRKNSKKKIESISGDFFNTENPHSLLTFDDAQSQLWETLNKQLPEAQFSALYLHSVEQMNITEIAHTLKKTKANIKILLHRVRKKITQELANGNEQINSIYFAAKNAMQAREIDFSPTTQK